MNDQIELPMRDDADDGDDALTLARYAERAYLEYAVSVVKGRALPDVCDGQKPVQRRILHAMNEMGLAPGAKPVKSARVVGDVLGKFHPHGDVAAYDALVRMAQSFTLRYPLIDGHGNFGSRDGDSPAAMRYTEARLTPYARLLLDEIDQGTVDFVPNYDGSTKEPRLLPARLPMLLLNGASGIAVGMATEIPPHNLHEVAEAAIAVLKNPEIDAAGLARIVPGPDFPGGGQIISSADDLREIYESGRGSIKMRGRHAIEELARGQWQLVVTELPQGVSAQKVLEEIEELTNPKVRAGKKSLTPEQLQLKSSVLAVLDAVRDESGKEAPVRLVFEPKTSKIDSDELLRVLRAHTSLETGVPVNLVTIGRDGRPRQKNLATILSEWCEFRLETVTRRSRHRLAQVDDRIHILEGRRLVLLRIDEVIRIIRESDEPKPALIDAFGLTDRQAEDILEIRLRQLARLEAIRIEKELASLREEKGRLEALLGSPARLRRQVIQEIEADAKQYGDARRTLIEAAERTTLEVRIPEEPVTVIVSQKGWARARQGHDRDYDPAQAGFKTGDAFYGAFEVMTTDNLYAVDTTGRAFSVAVSQLPSARGDGAPVTSFFDLEPGARIEHVFAARADAGVLLSTRRGYGLLCQAGDLAGRTKQGKSFVSVEEGDAPLRPALFEPRMDRVLCVSRAGHALVFDLGEVKVLRNGGRGVTMLKVDEADPMQQAIVFGAPGVRVQGTGRGGKAIDRVLSGAALENWRGARARKGRYLEPRVAEATLSLPKPAGDRGT
ncbi:MAG: DNA topoisomerase IV subunit A [Burkholderiaceae bacterium]|nr:DNA topoisomerase IV subunit A [Burkholderiaceae bacterium]